MQTSVRDKRQGGMLSRRGFLALASLVVTSLVGVTISRQWGFTQRRAPAQSGEDKTAFDPNILQVLIEFLATFFGISLDSVDRIDLLQRLSFGISRDAGRRHEYKILVSFADRVAQDLGGKDFLHADTDTRLEVIDRLVMTRRTKIASRIRALLSSDGERFLRMQKSTIPHLLRLYRHSGVPWRHRGYETWPGVSGEMLAYTRSPVGKAL